MAEFNSANQRIGWGDAYNQASSSGFDSSQFSTRKAARVAMLKTRFADIISKAQQTIDKNEESEGPGIMRPENVDVEQNQQRKKRRIESKVTNVKAKTITDMTNSELKKNRRITAAEAIRKKANSERKKKIEKEREASRYALEKVEASVYVDDFNKTYKEFMMLISS